jgi:hypothetical protein
MLVEHSGLGDCTPSIRGVRLDSELAIMKQRLALAAVLMRDTGVAAIVNTR